MIITLHLETTTTGFLYIYDEAREQEIDLDCELEFGFTPEQKQTMTDPSFDTEMELESIKCCLGSIDIDCIQNLEEVHEDALKLAAQEAYEDSCAEADYRREEAKYRALEEQ